MEFLPQQNKVVAGDKVSGQILATGKHVVVIGGGDTGSDCIGTSIRQGAASVTNFELMPMPPEQENKPLTWPYWPLKLRTSSSHEEGAERDFAVATKAFHGKDGRVESLTACHVEWVKDEKGGMAMKEVPGTEFTIPAQLVLLAMGYVHPVHEGMVAAARRRQGRARQREGRHRRAGCLRHLDPQGLRRGRHAPRPIAHRVGDPRGPAVRARGRRLPDG